MYTVYFTDGTKFEGGPYFESKWNEMPNKTIEKIKYSLVKQTVLLEGWNAYNHLVERVQYVNKAGYTVSKVILMVEDKSKVFKIIYDFVKKDVITEQCEIGKEYNGGKVTGWKEGKLSDNPLVVIPK